MTSFPIYWVMQKTHWPLKCCQIHIFYSNQISWNVTISYSIMFFIYIFSKYDWSWDKNWIKFTLFSISMPKIKNLDIYHTRLSIWGRAGGDSFGLALQWCMQFGWSCHQNTKTKKLITGTACLISAEVVVKSMSDNKCQFWEIDERPPQSVVCKLLLLIRLFLICWYADMLSEVYAGRRLDSLDLNWSDKIVKSWERKVSDK